MRMKERGKIRKRSSLLHSINKIFKGPKNILQLQSLKIRIGNRWLSRCARSWPTTPTAGGRSGDSWPTPSCTLTGVSQHPLKTCHSMLNTKVSAQKVDLLKGTEIGTRALGFYAEYESQSTRMQSSLEFSCDSTRITSFLRKLEISKLSIAFNWN